MGLTEHLNSYLEFLNYPKLKLFQNKNFVNGFKWRSIPWQHFNEVPAMSSDEIYKTPEQMKHREPGCHDVLNTFLTNYIKEYKILE